ncbi:MAG: UDP-N-acetylglucosamine 1-carboxyvinyltransferase [Hyphomicrobiales bacterium]|jgi:UDP-N-acetylglucosamine 1-carboxyvinyltransferase|nr:UDP-N-acetylglucosamine 1-carboxyvinyltransferase [Hyphomicrobiales bacterium]|tara:strand:+ start:638 stop:1912 length:1275 start_codon:yes stop_codon:yes gene_type:complete
MDLIEIIGNSPLEGKIKISGSKNASLPIMIASLLTKEKVELSNIPNLSDVLTLIDLMKSLGADIEYDKSLELKGKISCITKEILHSEASYDLVRKMRASFWVLAPLIARYGEAKVSLPGGCAIGIRPIDFYLSILKKMGVKLKLKDGYVYASIKNQLKSLNFSLDFPSVGVTHFFLMMASLAEGKSIINNAAKEPEVIALAEMLNKMGAKIKGHGTNTISIEGVSNLNGTKFSIPPDRIEAGTFAIAVSATGGNISLESVNPDEITLLSNLLRESGTKITTSKNLMKIKKDNKIINSIDVSTAPYPGFPTDLQAQFMTLMALGNGKSSIKENIFENRFMHVQELARFGANIKLKGDTAFIRGVKEFNSAPVMATDLRASASLIIAALSAKGKSTIRRIYHLDRGFDKIENKLRSCGAKIQRKRD